MKYSNLRKVAAGCRMVGSVCTVTAAIAVLPAVILFGAGLMKLGSEWERAQALVYGGGGVGLGIMAVLVWSAGVVQGAFGEALDALADMAENSSLLEQVERNTRGATPELVVGNLGPGRPTAPPPPAAAAPVEEAMSPAVATVTRTCRHCGTALAADVTRCKRCMKKVD
jgi:hypothetical protein